MGQICCSMRKKTKTRTNFSPQNKSRKTLMNLDKGLLFETYGFLSQLERRNDILKTKNRYMIEFLSNYEKNIKNENLALNLNSTHIIQGLYRENLENFTKFLNESYYTIYAFLFSFEIRDKTIDEDLLALQIIFDRQKPFLRYLSFDFKLCNISDENLEILSSYINQLFRIESLSLKFSKSSFSQKSFEVFSENLKELEFKKFTLNFSNVRLTHHSSNLLFQNLSKNNSLENLRLSYKIDDFTFEERSFFISQISFLGILPSLSSIYLNFNFLNEEELNNISTITKSLSKLQNLGLGFRFITISVVALSTLSLSFQYLLNLKILTINFSSNNLKDDDIIPFIFNLSFLNKLQTFYINLEKNELTTSTIIVFSKTLGKMLNLNSLSIYLDNNKIKDVGSISVSLLDMLYLNTFILSVRNNPLILDCSKPFQSVRLTYDYLVFDVSFE